MSKSEISGLYGLLDLSSLGDADAYRAVESALEGGARVIQYRDKSRGSEELSRGLVRLCVAAGRVFLINDDVLLAQRVGADGVHLGQTDMSPVEARALLGPDAVIGVTCHASVDLAVAAERAGADYVAFGRFFSSRTKPGASGAPVSVLEQARKRLSIPRVAIGGITVENGGQLLAAGASALAVSGGLFGCADIAAEAARFNGLFVNSRK